MRGYKTRFIQIVMLLFPQNSLRSSSRHTLGTGVKHIDIIIFYTANEFLNCFIKFILCSSFNGFDFPTPLSMSYYLRDVSEHFHTINVYMTLY